MPSWFTPALLLCCGLSAKSMLNLFCLFVGLLCNDIRISPLLSKLWSTSAVIGEDRSESDGFCWFESRVESSEECVSGRGMYG